MAKDVPVESRVAGAIYLKNFISKNWAGIINDGNKEYIRKCVVQCVAAAPEPINVHLTEIIATIVGHDFPHAWPSLKAEIKELLTSQNTRKWEGALSSLYVLVKNYQYKRSSDRMPMTEVMKTMQPLLLAILSNSLHLNNACANAQLLIIEKKILKIFFAVVNYALPLDILDNNNFKLWLDNIIVALGREVPSTAMELVQASKVQKWSTHIMLVVLERYADPGKLVSSQYALFSTNYNERHASSVLNALLIVLARFHKGEKIAPRAIDDALKYIGIS